MTVQKKASSEDLRNVEVKALRNHCNAHGKTFQKAKGDTYTHPDPAADIRNGIVEMVKANPSAASKAS